MTLREPSSTIVTAEEVSSTLLPLTFDCAEGAGVRFVAVWGAFPMLLAFLFDCVEGTDGRFMAL